MTNTEAKKAFADGVPVIYRNPQKFRGDIECRFISEVIIRRDKTGSPEFLVGAMDLKANAIYHDKPEFFRAKI